MPSVRPLAIKRVGEARTRGVAQTSVKLDGGAKPRLTSGGEAGMDGVKFQDRC